jgi:hypothetical protein
MEEEMEKQRNIDKVLFKEDLLQLWEWSTKNFDRRKPGAKKKRTPSEEDRESEYKLFEFELDSEALSRFKELNKKCGRHPPWFEDLSMKQKISWMKEFIKLAIELGIKKEVVENRAYYDEQNLAFNKAWEEAEQQKEDEKQKAELERISAEQETKLVEEFDSKVKFK